MKAIVAGTKSMSNSAKLINVSNISQGKSLIHSGNIKFSPVLGHSNESTASSLTTKVIVKLEIIQDYPLLVSPFSV